MQWAAMAAMEGSLTKLAQEGGGGRGQHPPSGHNAEANPRQTAGRRGTSRWGTSLVRIGAPGLHRPGAHFIFSFKFGKLKTWWDRIVVECAGLESS